MMDYNNSNKKLLLGYKSNKTERLFHYEIIEYWFMQNGKFQIWKQNKNFNNPKPLSLLKLQSRINYF